MYSIRNHAYSRQWDHSRRTPETIPAGTHTRDDGFVVAGHPKPVRPRRVRLADGPRGYGDSDVPPLAERREDEELIVATTDGTVRGYLFLTVDATLRVHPLERELSFEGAYVRRVFVHPDYREQGIASATLRAALDRARERGARTATALVAADNRPSQWLFESHEFERVRRRVYGRVGSLSWRRVDEL
mgnify:CR=1 FL=1